MSRRQDDEDLVLANRGSRNQNDPTTAIKNKSSSTHSQSHWWYTPDPKKDGKPAVDPALSPKMPMSQQPAQPQPQPSKKASESLHPGQSSTSWWFFGGEAAPKAPEPPKSGTLFQQPSLPSAKQNQSGQITPIGQEAGFSKPHEYHKRGFGDWGRHIDTGLAGKLGGQPGHIPATAFLGHDGNPPGVVHSVSISPSHPRYQEIIESAQLNQTPAAPAPFKSSFPNREEFEAMKREQTREEKLIKYPDAMAAVLRHDPWILRVPAYQDQVRGLTKAQLMKQWRQGLGVPEPVPTLAPRMRSRNWGHLRDESFNYPRSSTAPTGLDGFSPSNAGKYTRNLIHEVSYTPASPELQHLMDSADEKRAPDAPLPPSSR